MNNSELIITLTLIKGLGRKTINKIIRQGELNHLNSSEIIDYLNNINLKNRFNFIINLHLVLLLNQV